MALPPPPNSGIVEPLRALSAVAFFLVLIAGLQLFVFAADTAHYFAWTIAPSLSAALLGASYWSSIPLVVSAVLAPDWRHARIGYASVLTFTTLTLIVTLLHLDRLHFADPEPIAGVAAWAWLIVYVAVPPLLALALWWQARKAGMRTERVSRLPGFLRAIYAVVGLIVGVLGVEFLLFPGTTAAWWPWALTPLVAGAVGAWFLAYAVAAAAVVAANDRSPTLWPAVAFTSIGVLQLLALARYSGDFNWSQPGAIPYAAFWIVVIVVGTATVIIVRRPGR
jgi:hypothetical protein